MIGRKIKDLTGQRFGKLVVKARGEDKFYPSGRHEAQWICNCDCNPNKDLLIVASNLNTKNFQKSCGCDNKKGNRYDLSNEYGIGFTNNTNVEFYFDLEDYEKIKDYTWFENDHGYIVSDSIDRKRVRLHRIILNLGDLKKDQYIVDHINHNIKDNRKEQRL